MKPTGARRYVSLGGGLAVAVGAGGDKQFQARIRRPGAANATREPLGYFPATSVADARRKLLDVRADVKEGRDPAAARKRAEDGEIVTFAHLVDRYLARRQAGGLAPKTLIIETQALEPLRHALGDRPLADLSPRDFAAVVEREAGRLKEAGGTGRSANMSLAAVKRAYKHARRAGDYMAASPVAELGRPAREAARDRVLFDGRVLVDHLDRDRNEVGALAVALAGGGKFRTAPETRAALSLALVLGIRVGEAAALQWSAIHLDDDPPTLRIIKGKTKAAVRTLPLPGQAATLLRTLKARTGGGAYVFPATPAKRGSGRGEGRAPHLHPESISRALARIFEKLKIKAAVEHDLRRTCLSGIVELTGDDGLAERIAGHAGKTTLTRHYDQAKRLAPMLNALQQWADAVDDAAERRKAAEAAEAAERARS
ncbi:tyrosine-type recombinase/integrase [Methylocystis echinoides]|uniref:Integrase or site-specific recombinase n=1 Tax=Methylocystis echinoides TaxID=29468 RepID=A0A9W6GUP5_9HYPH|nr:tyrosine-type recombinase/integrase [Methylocystis echinoides]GLI93386.1 integrase or site-specific recombinase [Methylocystis echinoides]